MTPNSNDVLTMAFSKFADIGSRAQDFADDWRTMFAVVAAVISLSCTNWKSPDGCRSKIAVTAHESIARRISVLFSRTCIFMNQRELCHWTKTPATVQVQIGPAVRW